MSAIWGIIHLDQKEADYEQGIKMEQAMKLYKLDRCLTIKKMNAVLGCGIQYITTEAKKEHLPYYDEHNMILYTADCMLDNRKELIEQLSLEDETIPDGALLYQAYLAWGAKFTDHVLGVFTFVLYDGKKNTCSLYTDHTGSRSLYYCVVDQTIYFATIFAPLLAVLPSKYRGFNEKWMTACELIATPVMEFFPGLTPFDHISQVLAGHSMTCEYIKEQVVITKKRYWGFDHIRILKLKTQEEYRELFVNTLKECIQSVLRSTNETGITLSSGLDSSSAACIAAQLLEDRSKKLYSFTSVPLTDYKQDKDGYYITDESEGVQNICKAYPNISPEFVRCEGKNVCTDLDRIVKYLEFPHKSRQNVVWLDEIYDHASQKGCRVMLKGQYGNATISQGKILGRVYEDMKQLRIGSAYRQLNAFCKKNHISKKKAFKVLRDEFKKKLWYSKEKFDETTVQKPLLKRHNIIKVINRNLKAAGSDLMNSRGQRIRFMFDLSVFMQLGALDTRFGLFHGLIIRDPLKDKRMIELCASLPIKCFVQEGVERAAVRNYMRGVVPDAILDVTMRRGLQSADYVTRLSKDWNSIKQAMLTYLEQPKLLYYIDHIKLEQIKEEIRLDEILNLEDQLMKALMLCSCSVFLNYFSEGTLIEQ